MQLKLQQLKKICCDDDMTKYWGKNTKNRQYKYLMKLKAKLDFISRFVGVSYFFIKSSSATRVLRPLQEDESYQYFQERVRQRLYIQRNERLVTKETTKKKQRRNIYYKGDTAEY